MYCSNCAAPVMEGTCFCTNCGRPIAAAPKQQQEEAVSPVVSDPQPEAVSQAAVPADSPCVPEAAPGESAPLPELSGDDPQTPPEAQSDPAPAVEPAPEPVPQPPVKKRSPLLIPTVILAVLFSVGLLLYFLFPKEPEEVPPQTTAPSVQEDKGPTLPPWKEDDIRENTGGLRDDDFQPADESCFLMTDEGLMFLDWEYDGGPVLVIPNEIDGVPVTAIAPGGFAMLEGITTVVLPDHLETIGADAFRECSELRGVYLPQSMRSVGDYAFAGCIKLGSVYIYDSMESVGTGAFEGCAALHYLFYSGTFEEWNNLYNEFVTPFTYACCSDGDYYHGVQLP